MGWSAARAKATIEAWLEPLAGSGCDVRAGVKRCLGAWEIPFDQGSGGGALADHLGGGPEGKAWAERIARASQTFKFFGTRGAPADAFTPVVSSLVGDLDAPALLSGARSTMYVRTDTGYAGPYHKDQMPVVLEAMGLTDVCGRNGDGKALSPEALYRSGRHIEKIVRRFSDRRTWYDRASATLHHGYELPEVAPLEDPAVAAWLAALTGDMLANVLDWIAACAQDHIARKAAALVMIGPPGIGKTVIFRALARMWGARSFVPLADSIAQFNGSITRCPIVVDDECAAIRKGRVTSAEFRQRVQATERDYELKGKERVELHGCTREGITANDLGEVKLTGLDGAGVVDALRDRLLVVECGRPDDARAALADVRAGDDVGEDELARIMGHVAWLWASGAELPEGGAHGRFIGAGGALAERVAMAAVAGEGAALWDSLARFLDGDLVEAPDKAPPAAGWLLWRGKLWGNPSRLAKLLAHQFPQWAGHKGEIQIAAMLKAVASGEAERIRSSDGTRPKCYPIDPDRVWSLVE